MQKCISCGNWNKNYIFIFLSIVCLLIWKIFTGYAFDDETKYELKFLDTEKFSFHYLIFQIASYFFCMILSCIFLLKEKIEKKYNKAIKIKNNLSISSQRKTSFVSELNLIYMDKSEINRPINTKIFFVFTILLYIILEQAKIIFQKFFVHMDLWMIELYIMSFLNYKIFKIEIYKHQKLAFCIILFAIIFNIITIILTIVEDNKEKALYARYNWTVIIAVIIYFLYAFCLSYTFINIKNLMDLQFISIYVILFFYGAFGTLFCSLFCLIATFAKSNDENVISNYLFKVKDNNNDTYIENFYIFFDLFKNEEINNYVKKNEGLDLFFIGLFFSFYKLFTLKVIKDLTPLHKIFSYPLYYFSRKFILLCIKGNDIFNDERNNDIFIGSKLIIEFISDMFSVIGYLIYLEILEINFCGFNYNLRRNIMIRGDKDSFVPILSPTIREYDLYSDNDENGSNNTNSISSEIYV